MEVKTKKCVACEINKPLTEYYQYRSKCIKCHSKECSQKYVYRKTGIEREKYDDIRMNFLTDAQELSMYKLSKKYNIIYNTIRKWFKNGYIQEWQKKYNIEKKESA